MNVLSISATNGLALPIMLFFLMAAFFVFMYLMLADRPGAAWTVYVALVLLAILIPLVNKPKIRVETRVETMAEFEELSKDWKLVSISDDQIFTLEKR